MSKSTSSPNRGFLHSLTLPVGGLVLGVVILLICLIFSVTLGAADIPWTTVYRALTDFDGSQNHLIIRTVRLPRSLLAVMVGAAIAVSGALMQGITRNPLADPGILGINAGASFAVVIAIFIFGSSAPTAYVWYAFAGAGITAMSVYFLASFGRSGITPLNLTMAGAAISALLAALITTILIVSQRTLEEIRFWLAGSLAGADANIITQVLTYICIGLMLAFLLGKQITIFSLGEDIAQGLGQQTLWIKIAAGVSVFLLQGSAVAVTGGIGFIGLIVPHVVRFFVGVDYRWILPYSALFGSILLLSSDIFARLVIQPQELPVGIMTALVGGPFFIYLAKNQIKK